MARKKNYEDNDVIEKATELFWRNGYENTSMSLLESTMGINKFSIYSSFGSKQGVFLQSLRCYRNKLSPVVIKLKHSNDGRAAIKQYFYDCLATYTDATCSKGCLMTNTRAELSSNNNRGTSAEILNEIESFVTYQKQLFIEKLISEGEDTTSAAKKANYLIIAKQAISGASKVHSLHEINDFIDMTFSSI